MSESQGESPNVENLIERLRILASQRPGSLEVVLRLLQYLESLVAQGKAVAPVRDFVDFCAAQPELALMMSLLLGSFGEGIILEDEPENVVDDALPDDR